jgi:Arc/MetJ-type ribon-helix-helix transcriptional regulator
MPITLPQEHQRWLEARVASGQFDSVADAAAAAIAVAMAEDAEAGSDAMDWARPLVEQARSEVARGEAMPLDEHRRRMTERLAALKT